MRIGGIIAVIFALMIQSVMGNKFVKSSSLLTCMDNSQLTASHFEVLFYPKNRTVIFDVAAVSSIDAKVTANVELIVYGLNVLTRNISLCSLDFKASICPLTAGHLDLNSHYTIGKSITDIIPGVAYTIPDLDARVRVYLYDTDNGDALACVEAVLSNGKTVQTKYASWPIAAISGLGVITSGVVSVIGHSNTAAHIASNSMSLFVYFQSLAITSMMAVAKVPPIAAAWSQNFMWSLGIVKVGVVQNIANWYVQATGGSPTDIIDTSYLSISVQKLAKRMASAFVSKMYGLPTQDGLQPYYKRSSITLDNDDFGYSDHLNTTMYTTNERDKNVSSKILVLRGIQRVAYLAGLELTDLFLTSIIFLFFFTFVMVVCLGLFKAAIELAIRSHIMNEGKFNEYRQQWSHIIKGSLYRLLVLAFPQISVLCLWEFTNNDSAGAIVIAVFLFAIAIGLLSQAAARVIMLGRRSVRQFKNPAYLLFGDGDFLNKFGFIYVQFRADRYFFVSITLWYVLLKSLFVAVLQKNGRIQAVVVFAIELIYCVLVCWIRPYMDKRTNAFNITITIINTINALFFMFFSFVFNEPHVVASVMGVVYFILNAVFSLFLLLFTIITCVLALVYKNPDTRYQPMKDDRVSFLPKFGGDNKAARGANGDEELELVALGATAMRGHENGGKPVNIYDEDSSIYDDDANSDRYSPSGANADKSKTGAYKRNSLLADNYEPTQPSSTISGNPQSALSSYNSAFGSDSSLRSQRFNRNNHHVNFK